MESEIEIIKYISNMLLDKQWGGYAELIAFSEVYNVQVSIFDSFVSIQPITRVTTKSREKSIFLLFLEDHNDSIIP